MSRRGLNYTISLQDAGFSSQLDAERRRVSALTDEVENLNKQINNRGNGSSGFNGSGKSSGGLGSGAILKGNLMSGAIQAGVNLIKSYGVEIAMTTARIQGYENAIKFASGSTFEGAKNIEFLKKQSDDLGLSLESSYKGFKTFSGAMIGSKFSSDQVRKMFSDVQVATSAMNLSAEDSEGVYLALGQIMSKGKVQAEELRGQIGERIPGAFSIAAKAIGVSTSQLDKMMEKGDLMASDFLPKFTQELQKTFSGAIAVSSDSLQATLNRADNATLNLTTTLGDALEPAIKDSAEGWATFANVLSRAIAGQTPMADKTRELRLQLNAELEVLKDGNISLDDRRTLIEKINTQASPYLQNLLSEKSTIEDITAAQNELNTALNKKIAIQARNEIMADISKKLVAADKMILEAKIEKEKAKQTEGDWFNGSSEKQQKRHQRTIDAYTEARGYIMKDYNTQQKVLNQTLKDLGVTAEDEKTLMGGSNSSAAGNKTATGTTTTSAPSTSVASGRSVRNVTVHINKLVESLIVENHNEKLADNKAIRSNVSGGLIRVITDFEQIAE